MDASLSYTTGIYQPLRFFKRFVAVEAIKLDRNQIKRLVLTAALILLPSTLAIIALHDPLAVLKVRMVNPL